VTWFVKMGLIAFSITHTWQPVTSLVNVISPWNLDNRKKVRWPLYFVCSCTPLITQGYKPWYVQMKNSGIAIAGSWSRNFLWFRLTHLVRVLVNVKFHFRKSRFYALDNDILLQKFYILFPHCLFLIHFQVSVKLKFFS